MKDADVHLLDKLNVSGFRVLPLRSDHIKLALHYLSLKYSLQLKPILRKLNNLFPVWMQSPSSFDGLAGSKFKFEQHMCTVGAVETPMHGLEINKSLL